MKEFDIFKNPDKDEYEEITEAVTINDNYCPCLSYKNEDTKCMCKAFREQEESGFCHCGRYYKVKNAETIVIVGDCENGGENVEEKINALMDTLDGFGFIATFIKRKSTGNLSQYFTMRETCFTKIAKADLVVTVGAITENINEFLEWAAEIGKPVTDASRLTGDN
jgi:hypothetical protein